MERKQHYEVPKLEHYDIPMEQGFATTTGGTTEEITPGEEVDW